LRINLVSLIRSSPNFKKLKRATLGSRNQTLNLE
jgi:hypothetical protein